MKYLIVGGVAGGATAAARIRRNDESASITLFERGNYISYANCGLPYYIGGTIADRSRLLLQTPQSFSARYAVDVRVGHEVTAINPAEKTVQVREIASGSEYSERYDKLILSPGAEPLRPPLPGIETEGIFTIRNVADTDRIKAWIGKNNVRRAVVVGAGFIGLEMAENLHDAGAEVTIVEMAPQVMPPIDYTMAALVHQELFRKNVALRLGSRVERFEPKPEGILVGLHDGTTLTADIVILSIGVKPDIRLAKEAGLQIGKSGGIAVNEYLQTSHPDIYAIGDAIETHNPITGKQFTPYLAGPANRQARLCADHATGDPSRPYEGSIATAIAKVFDLTVASTGVNSRLLNAENIPFQTAITHSGSHAGYYPGATPMSIQLLFEPQTGRIFGGQIVGYEGVDKRIDVLSAFIAKGGTVRDLTEWEHAYAPPYSSAKDPLHIAAFVAENIMKNRMNSITWELLLKERNVVTLIDVRTPEEFALGHIEGAFNIPVDSLRNRIDEIPKNQPIVVYCAVGLRGYLAARTLMQKGFTDVRNLSGGYKIWEAATADLRKLANPLGPNEAGGCITHSCNGPRNSDIEVSERSDSGAGTPHEEVVIDACGLQCPGPIMRLKQVCDNTPSGAVIRVLATDPGFARDVRSWAKMTGNELLSIEEKQGKVDVRLKRQDACPIKTDSAPRNDKTMVVFSDDLDRAIASFVIANGAASAGRKVTMFFTFWGLNVIKKREKPAVSKNLIQKMFGWMMPAHSGKLALSKMNMMGIGPAMIRGIMKKNRIDSLESLIFQARRSGIEMMACQMSMDVMGVKREELLDGITVGGVAAYLDAAESANVNLFI